MVARKLVTSKTRITVYLKEGLKEKLDQLAALRNRSTSNLVETLVEEAIKQAQKSGELDDPESAKNKNS